MPAASGSALADQGRQEFEHFMELRRHVKRMQAGTPLLLRLAEANGQEELQICTFWVTADLQTLKWRDQEGSGLEREVPLSCIAEVSEDSGPPLGGAASAEDASHYALTLVLLAGEGASQKELPRTMGLICASAEDLAAWREGLKFLVGALPPAPDGAGSQADSDLQLEGGDLQQQLRLQVEANQRLRKENEMLREMVRRKDVTIAQLLRDVQGRQAALDRCGKTESTSRESDDHLRDREVAILRRKNHRLQKTLRAKQQTLSDLLQLLGRVTQQQGAESSAVEDVGDSEEEDGEGAANTAAVAAARSGGTSPARSPAGQAVAPAAKRSPARGAAPAAAASGEDRAGSDASSDAGGLADALGRLAGIALRPRQLLPTPAPPQLQPQPQQQQQRQPPQQQPPASNVAAFRPPPRSPAGTAPAAKAAPASPAAGAAGPKASAVPKAAATATNAQAQRAAAAAAGRVARPAVGGSQAALQVLVQELAMLEEKKLVVEQLARRLEPPSDGEEDDGFPLH